MIYPQPFVIGICGGSGSGKTFIINQIKNKFSEQHISILSQDNYYKPREEQPKDEQGIHNFDSPDSIYRNEFENDLKQLIAGKEASRQEYTYNNPSKTPSLIVVRPAPVIIVEGIFIFHYQAIFNSLHLKVFIEVEEEIKLQRRIQRDAVERGYDQSDVLYRYKNHVAPAFEKYIFPYQKMVDLTVINNETDHSSTNALYDHISIKLSEI